MRKVRLIVVFVVALLGGFGQSVAISGELVESHGPWKINWSTGRLEYIGAVATNTQMGKEYKELEGAIWKSARQDVVQAIPSIRTAYEGANENTRRWSEAAVARVQKNLHSKKTVYLPDGSIAVKLTAEAGDFFYAEAAKSLENSTTLSSDSCTGVVLRLAKAEKPMPYYKLVDNGGNTLLSLDQISKSAYSKNLMGRWFRSPTAAEIQSVVGSRTLEFHVVAAERGVLKMESKEDAKNLLSCGTALSQSRIALAVP
jgi:hypothetical protein